MPVTDPIADMLTRIRNAAMRYQDTVRIRSSKVCLSIAETLKAEGFIDGFEVVACERTQVQNDLLVRMRYGRAGEKVIRRLQRVSKPGRRIYAKVKELKPVLGGMGIYILSTPKGVMSDRQARESNIGGEVLCRVE
ncbi:MAG: 30S ribosomal protein S8 [Planctomycetota bacterium]|nr:30S ribosomal protein S8 [Planctomycetota bacterium]